MSWLPRPSFLYAASRDDQFYCRSVAPSSPPPSTPLPLMIWSPAIDSESPLFPSPSSGHPPSPQPPNSGPNEECARYRRRGQGRPTSDTFALHSWLGGRRRWSQRATTTEKERGRKKAFHRRITPSYSVEEEGAPWGSVLLSLFFLPERIQVSHPLPPSRVHGGRKKLECCCMREVVNRLFPPPCHPSPLSFRLLHPRSF